jgi:hypothetical protein
LAHYGLGMEAFDAVRRALRMNKDGKIAYQLLADIGVVPNQNDRQPLNGTPESDEEADVQKQMALLFQCAVERSLLYRIALGGMEEHLEAVDDVLRRFSFGPYFNDTNRGVQARPARGAGEGRND